jgi:hypothetical protein
MLLAALLALSTPLQVGQPADIAASAYTFRADRKPEENAPESWLALMHFAGLPLDRPLDIHDP